MRRTKPQARAARCSSKFRTELRLHRLEDRAVPALISWDGGGGSLVWNNAANWSGDVLPGPGDDVFIDVPGTATVTFNTTATVSKLTLSDPFNVTGGSLTVTNGFSVGAQVNVTTSGWGTTLTTQGATSINGANMLALSGSKITLGGMTAYGVGSSLESTLEANGWGSRLEMPALTTLTGAGLFRLLHVQATAGGTVTMPALPQVGSGNVEFKTDGGGSQMDLSAMTSFSPAFDYDYLTITNGGSVIAPLLTKVERATLTLSALATFPANQITSLNGSSVAVSGGLQVTFPNVTSLQATSLNTKYEATGFTSRIAFPNVTNIVGPTLNNYARVLALSGGRVELPVLTSFTSGNIEIRATGGGSYVDLPVLNTLAPQFDLAILQANTAATVNVPLLTKINRTTVKIGDTSVLPTAQVTDLTSSGVSASNGAQVSFPGITSYACGGITCALEATGSGSLLTFPNLNKITGANYGSMLRIQGISGGRVEVPLVTKLETGYTELKADGDGSYVHFPQLTTFNPSNDGGNLTVAKGGNVNVPLLTQVNRVVMSIGQVTSVLPTAQMTNIDNTSVFVTAGATVNFPGITAYQCGSTAPTLRADGAGSTLTFPNLTSLKGAAGFNTFRLQAISGGRTNVPVLTKLDAGNTELRSEGGLSYLDLPSLQSFSLSIDTGFINAYTSATINVPVLTKINGVTITISDTSSVQTAQVTDINATGVTASGGAKVSFPGVTAYVGSNSGSPTLQATGGGSLLQFPNLTSLKGASSFWNVKVQAMLGGRLEINALPQIIQGNIDLRSDGGGSVLDAQALTTFAPTNEIGTFTIINGGLVNASLLTKINLVSVLISDSAKWSTTQVTNIDNTKILVFAGSHVIFPGVVSFSGAETLNPDLRADGAGSLLQFPNLTTIKGSSGFGRTRVMATAGGRVEINAVTGLTAGNIELQADGEGGEIRALGLTTLAPATSTGYITAINGGWVNAPILATINRTIVTISDAATFATAQVTDLSGSSVYVNNGAKVSFPGITSYVCGSADLTFQANGATSLLQFPNLVDMKGSSGFNSLHVVALNGGRVEQKALTSLNLGAIELRSDGGGSMLDLPNLWEFALTNENGIVTVANGGAINAPILSKYRRVTINISDAGALPTAQINDLTSSSVVASNGAQVSLPGVTSYDAAALSALFQASGSGTKLTFPNLTTLKGSLSTSAMQVVATTGGRLELPLLTKIDSGTTELRSQSAGSVLHLPAFTLFAPASSKGAIKVNTAGRLNTAASLELQNVTLTIDPAALTNFTDLKLNDAAYLEGTGPLTANVVNGGYVRPAGDFGTGYLLINGNYTQTGTGKLAIEINGLTPGTQYDRLGVTGTVSLAGTLIGTSGYDAPDGTQILFLDAANPAAITGKFTGLSEGTPLTLTGRTYLVSYQGGTGNDGVLTRTVGVLPPAKITAVQVNDGSSQRSRVTSIRVTFDRQVTLPVDVASAFQLVRQSDSAAVTLSAAVDNTGPTTAVTLTFMSGPIRSSSLDDGRYTLTALAAQISSGNFDGDGNGTGGDNYVLVGDLSNKLFCLFGDNDGDGDVDSSDFGQFRTAYGGANSTFDFDGDGDVDSTDFGQFRTRFGATI